MKKLVLLLIGAFALTATSFAQTKGKISGNLLDEKKQALPFANVLLLKAKDSTLVKGSVSDDKGEFLFEQLADNQYVVSVSSVGYQKYFSPKIIISSENQTVSLKEILLSLAEKSLGEVTVTAKKPLIEMQADKLVMNVENSIVATGSTAMEVLEKAPGVSIDNNDNISLKGKSGILIYMDGKPTYMSQSDLATYLKNMSSDQIEKIEIISNPSARYDAAGKAIINIITKKNKNFGTNGSLSAGMGIGLGPKAATSELNGMPQYEQLPNVMRHNTSLTLNNRNGKFNLFGNLSYSDGGGAQSNVFKRVVDGTLYDQYGYHKNAWNNTSYKAGVDYFLDKKTTIGVLVNGSFGTWNPPVFFNNAYIKSTEGVLQSSPITNSNPYNSWNNTTYNANFKHTFDSTGRHPAGRELTADIDFSTYDNLSKERNMMTNFFDATGKEYGTPLNIRSNIPNKYTITAIKIDYSLPFTKAKAKLDFGGKSSWVKSDNDIKFYNVVNTIESPDILRTNHFIYTENVNALYTSFSKEISKKINLQVGLRMENTKSKGNSLTLNTTKERKYTNFFPSAFLKQTINKNNQIAYSFSRRIERPDYESLNPFVFFLDPYTYELGNEYLKPQYTNSFEVSHTYKETFITTLGYSRTTDFMAQIIKNAIDDPAIYAKIKAASAGTNVDPSKITYAIKDNIALFENYNLGFTFPVKFNKWWTANNTASLFYNKYSGSISGTFLDYGKTAYTFNTSHVFTLPKATTIEASMWYNSPNVYGQFLSRQQYAVNLGVKKALFNKKVDLKLTVNDLFKTNYWQGSVGDITNPKPNQVNMRIINHWSSRYIGLTVSYKFGNSNVKSARNRATATEAEQNRVKSGN